MTAPEAPPRREAEFWEDFWDASSGDNARRATHVISAQIALDLLRGEHPDRLLDLGCGRGEVAEIVARRTSAWIMAVDVSERAVHATTERASVARLADRLHAARADCYRLGFADRTFDAVMSFGYASAASYEGAEVEVARVLRPGGVAIIDFRNLSIYNTLLQPRVGWRMWRRYRRHDKVYHLGPIGLREHFAAAGLHLEAVRYFNTYPPLGNRLSVNAYLNLDRFGRRIGRPLARVLVAKFRRA